MNPYSLEPLPSDVRLKVAQNFRSVRKLLKWSQAEAAHRAAMSLGSLKRFESTGQISFDSLLRLALIAGRLDDFKKVFDITGDPGRIETLMK
jgi:transcriptional regulator with XRE-family HTH domain